VRGISLANKNDEVIGMVCVEDPATTSILVVSEKGFGKRTYLNDPEDGSEIYRITNRGAKGVKTMNITEKTGSLIAMKGVTDNEDLMIITKSGLTIRLAVSLLRFTGRATQGVKLINLRNNDSIAAVSEVAKSVEVEEPEVDANTDNTETTE
jgi:DNA gyrase subunit A